LRKALEVRKQKRVSIGDRKVKTEAVLDRGKEGVQRLY